MATIKVSKMVLATAVKGLSQVVPVRPARKVFGCVKFKAAEGTLRILGTDLEQWAEFRQRGVEGEAEFLFNLGELKELLKLMFSSDELVFEAQTDGKVSVSVQINGNGNVREYEVPELVDFPPEPEVKTSALAVGPEFFHKLRLAAPMVLKDKVNAVMKCISVADRRIVASNRRELIVLNFNLGLDEPILLPVPKLLNLFDGNDNLGSIARDGDLVELRTSAWRNLIRIPPGTFPKYDQVVPAPSTLTNEFILGDSDAKLLLSTLAKLKIAEQFEPVTLYGNADGVHLVAGIGNPAVIRLPESKFESSKADAPLIYTLAKNYLLDALRCGFNRLRSGDAQLVVAQPVQGDGFLVLMALSTRLTPEQVAAIVGKSSTPNVPTTQPVKTEEPTMSKATPVPAPVAPATSVSNDYKVVPAASPDPFAGLNAALEQLHAAGTALNVCINEIVRQSREVQRSVKQRERNFRELQLTIERFKKVANF